MSFLLTTVFPQPLHGTCDVVRVRNDLLNKQMNKCIKERKNEQLAFVDLQTSVTPALPSPNLLSNQHQGSKLPSAPSPALLQPQLLPIQNARKAYTYLCYSSDLKYNKNKPKRNPLPMDHSGL